MSTSGRRPDSSIMSRASCSIDTGSPISSTNTSPPPPRDAARMTSWTASGIVMNYRVMRSSVTVTGPPSAIWRRKIGTTEPDEPSTLPNRTVAKHVCVKRCAAAPTAHPPPLDGFPGDPLRPPHPRRRLAGLVGRDEHDPRDARLARHARHQARRERVVAHRLDRVELHQRDVLVRRRVEDDRRSVLGEDLAHPLALLAVSEHRGEHGRMDVAVVLELALDAEEVLLGVVDQDEPPRCDARDLAAQL